MNILKDFQVYLTWPNNALIWWGNSEDYHSGMKHWVAIIPLRKTITWIINMNKLINWMSPKGSSNSVWSSLQNLKVKERRIYHLTKQEMTTLINRWNTNTKVLYSQNLQQEITPWITLNKVQNTHLITVKGDSQNEIYFIFHYFKLIVH